MGRLSHLLTRGLALSLLLGCGNDQHPPSPTEASRGAPDSIPRASFAVAMRIPRVDDSTEPLLGNVYSGFVRGGRVFIANGANREVLEYDTAGMLLRRIGRSGRGPGEFMTIRWIAPLGPDSLLVLDRELRRVTVFDSAGAYVRSFNLTLPEAGEPQWIAEYDTGLALRYSKGVDPRTLTDGGIGRDSDVVILMTRNPAPGANPSAVLPAFPGRWWKRVPAAGRFHLRSIEGGASPVVAVHDGVLIASSSDVQAVRRWERGHWQISPLRGQAWDNGEVQGAPGVPARLYDGLVVGMGGRFWLGDSRSADSSVRIWRVFDSMGALTKVVSLPSVFRPWQAESSQIFGRGERADGSEYVEILRILSPERR